jgi:hypothetical protein
MKCKFMGRKGTVCHTGYVVNGTQVDASIFDLIVIENCSVIYNFWTVEMESISDETAMDSRMGLSLWKKQFEALFQN